jgi:environmental stress-induced protein Ves
MVLKGKVRLSHNGKKGDWLQSGDQEGFSGDWDTVSEGLVTDFNLMTSDSGNGVLTNINLPSGEKENIALCRQEEGNVFLALYLSSPGQVTLSDGYTKYLIKEKETVIVEVGKEDGVVGVIVENTSDTTVRIIKAEISVV